MNKFTLLIVLMLFSFWAKAQISAKSYGTYCQVFKLPSDLDTITFVVYGTKADLKVKKPLFFFRQGSRPTPILWEEKGQFFPIFPFSLKPYTADYHFVMVQKSGTFLSADSAAFARFDSAMQVADPVYFNPTYMANNNLDKATQQCYEVLSYLTKQDWIDRTKMIFCGGSEGFTVGANLLANFKTSITHAILFSGHVGRRFENEIFQLREASRQGKMTSQESQMQIDELYKVWEDICQNPKSIDKTYGDTYYANHSFSFNNIDNLLKINIPLYIAYGTDDNEIAAGLDYLPLAFIAKGKRNLLLKAYPNHDHQFFEQKRDVNHQIINKVYRGDEVAKDWMDWIKK